MERISRFRSMLFLALFAFLLIDHWTLPFLQSSAPVEFVPVH